MRAAFVFALTAAIGLAWTPGTPVPVALLVPAFVAICAAAGWALRGE